LCARVNGENPTKYKTTRPIERVANAGHRAAALKARAPGIETVLVDCIVDLPFVVGL
jgi:hypothetical protein